MNIVTLDLSHAIGNLLELQNCQLMSTNAMGSKVLTPREYLQITWSHILCTGLDKWQTGFVIMAYFSFPSTQTHINRLYHFLYDWIALYIF